MMAREWADQAACINVGPDFTEVEEVIQVAVCHSCPVRFECLNAAMAEEQDTSIWRTRYTVRGGLTGWERQRLAKAGRP